MRRGWLPLVLVLWGSLIWANYWPAFGFPPDWLVSFFWPADWEPKALVLFKAFAGHVRLGVAAFLSILAFNQSGRRCCTWLGLKGPFPVTSLPVGLVLAGMAGLGLGLAGLFYPAVLVLCLAGGILSGYLGAPRIGFPRRPSPSILLAGAVALTALAGALTPEITYDAMAYHLGAPERFLAIHRIIRLEHMFFSDFPLALQMVYSFARALAGEGAVKLLHWALGAGCMVQTALLARKFFGDAVSGWGLAFLAATPFLATQMTRANVDLGVMFFTGAAIYGLLRGGAAGMATAGFFMGAAAIVKLTGIYGLIAAVAVFGLARPKRIGAVVLAAGIPLLPWLTRGFLFAGNPVYPFFSDWLGGVGWSPENDAIYRLDMTGPSSFALQYPLALDRLAGLWLLFQHDRGEGAALGPFALTLLPAAIFVRLPRKARLLGYFCLVYWFLWFITARDGRFLLPVWPAVSIFGAALLVAMDSCGIKVPLLKPAFVAAIAATPLITATQIYRSHNPAPVLVGAVSGREYRDNLIHPVGKYLPLMRFAAGRALKKGKILVVGDVKAPQAGHASIYPSMFDTPHVVEWVRESASAERMAVKFRQRGVSIIFYNVAGAAYLRERFGQYEYEGEQERILREFWERRLEPLGEIREEGRLLIGVYRFLERPGPSRSIPLPGDVR